MPGHSLIKNIFTLFEDDSKKDIAKKMVYYVQDLAQISSDGLKEDEKLTFIQRSQEIMNELSKFALK